MFTGYSPIVYHPFRVSQILYIFYVIIITVAVHQVYTNVYYFVSLQ